MNETTTAEDRCRGVLVGLAAGDRIGGPIRMAVRLAESLVASGGFNAADILNRYLAWWREGAFDTGPVSDRAFALLAAGMLAREATARSAETIPCLTIASALAQEWPPNEA